MDLVAAARPRPWGTEMGWPHMKRVKHTAKQAEFKKYFALGKVTADPTIKGDKDEEFEMVRIDGKWFLDDI